MGTEIFFIPLLRVVLILLLPRCYGRQTKIWKCVRGKEGCSSINLCFLLLSRVARLLVKWGTLSNDALSVAQSLVVLGIGQLHANALGGAIWYFCKITLKSSYLISVIYIHDRPIENAWNTRCNISIHVPYIFYYFVLWPTNAQFIPVINQLDAQNVCVTISLFHASTCFEHMCSSSHL